MILQQKPYQQLIQDLIGILLNVRQHIKEGSDCTWTYYETAREMRDDIDKYIDGLEKGDTRFLEDIDLHFAPTAAYQEHSMANDWTDEYLCIADRFDKIYKAFRNSSL